MTGFERFAYVVQEVAQTPGLPFRFGMMIAAAIILGYLMFDNYQFWLKLFITGVVFIMFNEWMHYALMDQARIYMPGIVVGVASAVIYGIGIGVGVYIRRRYRVKREKVEKVAEQVITEIRNGHIEAYDHIVSSGEKE